jgi:urea ABC transporter permease protein UrtB
MEFIATATSPLIVQTAIERGLLFTTSISTLVLVALGLTIIYGFMGVINLAHGAMLMLGAYTTYTVQSMGLPVLTALFIAPVVVGVLGYLMEISLIKRLYGDNLKAVLATWGVAILLREGVTLIYGTDRRQVEQPFSGTVDFLGAQYPTYWLFITLLTVAVLVAVWAVIEYTDTGMMAVAVLENRTMAKSMGINSRRMDKYTFAFGSALAGLGGAVVAPLGSVSSGMGLSWLINSFLVVVIGGIGSILGTVAGGVFIGGTEQSLIWYFSDNLALAELLLYVIAILVMLLRPDGIIRQVNQ